MSLFFSKQNNQDFSFSSESAEAQRRRLQVEELSTSCRQLRNENTRLKEPLSSIQQLVLPS